MLRLHNTLTQKKEPFQPAQAPNVKMFTCGPSTYQRAHIGNYRTFLFEDILQRYLEYLGYRVTRAMALTDVEDKAILQAKKEGLSVEELSGRNEAVFFGDFELLGIKKPDYSVRASDAVDQAAGLIAKLLESGYAYRHKYLGTENIYFRPLKFDGFGKLSHLDMSKWPKKPRRFHKDTYPGTPWNMGDFIIWHGCALEGVCYETPIGNGRPAWNIQDAAIATKTLGFTIDIACGGIDNLVRHHDYTLAIAESVSGTQFARFWLHGGHLYVNGKKMSKSLGNVYYTTDVLAKGFSGVQLRFFLIYAPYRERLNFTFERLLDVSRKLDAVRGMVADLQNTKPASQSRGDPKMGAELAADFENHMNDDLNVKGAFDGFSQNLALIHQKRYTLAAGELKNVLDGLRRIDTVLRCLF
ncbi:MAG: class I tRNA ligase family protein [Candidatus Bathyarchaeota archaeon]|nr:class I tRNA ligase family protein [Candidatus Bathyarchaeota archaeon]